MSYERLAKRSPLDEISQRFSQPVGADIRRATSDASSERARPNAPTDAQMTGLLQRVEQRFDGLSGALAEMTRRQNALMAELKAMREERDHWQRMAERLWTEQSRRRADGRQGATTVAGP